MLVMQRKPGESIMIGLGVVVRVLNVRGRSVSIGIEAPKDIAVNRDEVHAKIHAVQHTPPCLVHRGGLCTCGASRIVQSDEAVKS